MLRRILKPSLVWEKKVVTLSDARSNRSIKEVMTPSIPKVARSQGEDRKFSRRNPLGELVTNTAKAERGDREHGIIGRFMTTGSHCHP